MKKLFVGVLMAMLLISLQTIQVFAAQQYLSPSQAQVVDFSRNEYIPPYIGSQVTSYEVVFNGAIDPSSINKDSIKLNYFSPKRSRTHFDVNLGKNVMIRPAGSDSFPVVVKSIAVNGAKLIIQCEDMPSSPPSAVTDFNLVIGGGYNITLTTANVTKTINPEADKFTYHTYKDDKVSFNYRLFTPEVSTGQKVPVVLALHGAGQSADLNNYDNNAQLTANRMIVAWAAKDFQKDNPTYVIAPQFPSVKASNETGDYHKAYIKIIDDLVASGKVDKNRIYASTLSMGARIFYNMIATYPDYFAAAIINSGNADKVDLSVVTSIPIHIFHGEGDPIVPTQCGIDAYKALMLTNKNNIKLTLYPSMQIYDKKIANLHNSWELSDVDINNLKEVFTYVKNKPVQLEAAVGSRIIVNGKLVNTDLTPLVVEGNTLLPLETIANHLGFIVSVDNELQCATIIKGAIVIVIDITSGIVEKNGQLAQTALPVSMINNVLYVNADFFSKYTDSRVDLTTISAGAKAVISITSR